MHITKRNTHKTTRKLLLCITKAGGEITTEITVLQIVFVKKTTKNILNQRYVVLNQQTYRKYIIFHRFILKINEGKLSFSNKKFYSILLFLRNMMSFFCNFIALNTN